MVLQFDLRAFPTKTRTFHVQVDIWMSLVEFRVEVTMDVKELFGWKLSQNHCCFSELMRLAKEKLATVTIVEGARGETLYVFNPVECDSSSTELKHS